MKLLVHLLLLSYLPQVSANPLDVKLDEPLMIFDVTGDQWREANYIRVDKTIGGPEGLFIDFPYVEYSNGDRSVFVADSETARGLCLNFGEKNVSNIDINFTDEDQSFFKRGFIFQKLYAVKVEEGRLIEFEADDSTPLIKQLHCTR
jgi:hypothetical protein